VQPINDDTTSVFSVNNQSSSAIFTVDSVNSLAKSGVGQHVVNTSTKDFGLWDFSPSAGEHHPLTTIPMITSASDGDFTGEVNGSAWGGTSANPATSLTIASASLELIPCLWILRSNITISEISYCLASDAASTVNIHAMRYDFVSGAGSTAGDLSNGLTLAQTGSSPSSLTAIVTGADRISNGSLTLNKTTADTGQAIVLFGEASDADDMTIQVTIKYYLR
jgi:hypothetical protein